MPLNTQEDSGSSGEQTPAPLPITHLPEGGNGHSGRVIGIIFTVVVVIAAVFLLYTYGIIDFHKRPAQSPSTAESVTEEPPAAAPHETPATSQPTQQASAAPSTPAPMKSAPTEQKTFKPPTESAGHYTIYIGAFRDRAIADEEVGRWHDAGYVATVKESRDWYCIQLGRFQSIAETRDIIDTLKDGFEGGYFVGPA